MKFLLLIFLILSFTISAQTKKTATELQNNSQIDLEKNYDKLFVFQSSNHETEQKLYIKKGIKATLDFKLIIIQSNCESELQGSVASNHQANKKQNADSEGKISEFVEYEYKNEEYSISILISKTKDFAKIVYTRSDSNSSVCNFESGQLMQAE